MYSKGINRVKLSQVAPTAIHHHFSKIASRYRRLRITDLEPIAFVARELEELGRVEAADIGCGAGRYDLLLCKFLGDKLGLACVDANADMLEALDTHLKECDVSNFMTVNSKAERLPFPSGALDCVCTFNAVHHFNLPDFLKESARILKNGGYLFIYTRLQEQNKRNIWGQYFPEFYRKEARLYELDTFKQAVAAVPALWIKSIEYFKYRRIATLEQLVERARAHHYSTFWLYSPKELEEAITGFAQNVKCNFKGDHQLSWFDENIMFVLRKGD